MNAHDALYINSIYEELGISQKEFDSLMTDFYSELQESVRGIYRDILRGVILRHKLEYPETLLRVGDSQKYINILRRCGLIGYKKGIKVHKDSNGGKYSLMNGVEIKAFLRQTAVRERLLSILTKSSGFVSGVEEFLSKEQERLAEINKGGTDIYHAPPVGIRHLMRQATGEDTPSVSLEKFEKIFGFGEEIRKILEKPWKTRRIASKEQILSNKRFINFLRRGFKRIQTEGTITRFSEALISLIRSWNEQDKEETLYIPQNIYHDTNNLNLCSILGIQGYKNQDILRSLGLSEKTWKAPLGRGGKLSGIRRRTKKIQHQLHTMIEQASGA